MATSTLTVRAASRSDLDAIRTIYNEGIADRVATLEESPKTPQEMNDWWSLHHGYPVVVATEGSAIVGWAALNRFSHRCAHAGVADLSVYVARARRSRGVGFALLAALETAAVARGIHKIVLHALDSNEAGKRLYRKAGFSDVGVFRAHGMLDGRRVDIVAMEKILLP